MWKRLQSLWGGAEMPPVASEKMDDQAEVAPPAERRVSQETTGAGDPVAQAQAQRDSVSAVSLDEEAVNLMTYQQAYQANMKVISTANQLFDDMLSAF